MIQYKDWAPITFDMTGLSISAQQEWFVAPVSRTRNGGLVEQANWGAFLDALLPSDEGDDYEIHRFGHWACGWFEIMLLKRGTTAYEIGRKAEMKLADYPVLDDMMLEGLERNEEERVWKSMRLRDRVMLCADAGLSIFAARRTDAPFRANGECIVKVDL